MINTLRYKEDLIQFLIVKKEKEIILINDPIFKLISDLSDINKIENYQYYTKLLYINKNNIHEMLYNKEEFINIKIFHTLTFYFYLSLLINDNRDNINYIYSFDFIIGISNIFLKNSHVPPCTSTLIQIGYIIRIFSERESLYISVNINVW